MSKCPEELCSCQRSHCLHPCPVCSWNAPGKQQPGIFTANQPPRSQQGGLWGPKGYSPTQGMLTKGYFLAQLPQTNGKGCEGGVCSRMLDLKCHSQQHPQGLKGRAKKSPVLPSERQGEDSDRPKLPGCGLPLQTPHSSRSVHGSASAARGNHISTPCLSFPAGKAGIKQHTAPDFWAEGV